jgi:hypothetical protein
MTYKSRQYGEKDDHKLRKAIIDQQMSYNDAPERKRQKNKRNGCQKLLGGNRGERQ